jgi:ABC-type bacteriocin/lantibiotic exporter with double-glycine peptidase domain
MILDIPDVRQRSEVDCGPACVAAVVRYFGQRISLADATAALLTTEHHGTDPSAIQAYLKRRGLRVLAGDMNDTDLRLAVKFGRPVIAVTAGHYVVVCGWDRYRVAVQDPACGFSWVPYTDFAACWADYSRWGSKFDQFGIAVWR